MSLETKKEINKEAKNKPRKSSTNTFVKIFLVIMSIAMIIPILGSLLFQIF